MKCFYTKYEYDNDNKLIAVQRNGMRITYTYDSEGNVIKTNDGNNVSK